MIALGKVQISLVTNIGRKPRVDGPQDVNISGPQVELLYHVVTLDHVS
jgi:hypothetical protein